MKIKTIDVEAKEWFDKVYGNSYFSALVIVNYGMKTEKRISLPYQYGYGDHYLDMAGEALRKEILKDEKTAGDHFSLWQYCRDKKIILRKSKQENCRKKDLWRG